ncbi:hypothetical protein ACMHYB_28590 [Sorangium sp. So ce1128]
MVEEPAQARDQLVVTGLETLRWTLAGAIEQRERAQPHAASGEEIEDPVSAARR